MTPTEPDELTLDTEQASEPEDPEQASEPVAQIASTKARTSKKASA